jgi:hypothetical protein
MYLDQITSLRTEMRHPANGISFTPEQVCKSDRLEVWRSNWNGSALAFNEFRLMRGRELVVARRQDDF